jgi:hypothetical protein
MHGDVSYRCSSEHACKQGTGSRTSQRKGARAQFGLHEAPPLDIMTMASIESLVLHKPVWMLPACQQSSISGLGDRTPKDAACPGKFARTASKHVLVFI